MQQLDSVPGEHMPSSSPRGAIPSRRIAEYETESLMGGHCIVVVEGPSDAKYYSAWFEDLQIRAIAVEVSLVEPPDGGYPVGHLTGGHFVEFGARDRVLWHAKNEGSSQSGVAFIVDRDLSFEEHYRELDFLFVTDFPALEAYWLVPEAVEWFVRAFDVLPAGLTTPDDRERAKKAFVEWFKAALGSLLLPLYRLHELQRQAPEPGEWPTDLRKFTARGQDDEGRVPGLDVPRLAAQLGVDPRDMSTMDNFPVSLEGLRAIAYGHDLAQAVWVLFPRMRQEHGVLSWEHLEDRMLSSLQGVWLEGFGLFRDLATWAEG